MEEEDQELSREHHAEERLEFFNKLQAKLDELVKNSGLQNVEVGITPQGATDLVATAEIMAAQRALDYAQEASVGDILWWKDKAGRTFYFSIDEKSKSGYAVEGRAREIDSDGNSHDYPLARIQGASFGGALRLGFISENIPVELVLVPPDLPTADEVSKMTEEEWNNRPRLQEIKKSPVTDMGLISAVDIQKL